MFVEINDYIAARNTANMTLADRYAVVKAELEAVQTKLDAIKAEIRNFSHDGVIEGEFATLTITYTTPKRFSSKAAKAFLTADQVAACTETGSLVETIRVKNKLAVAA